MKRSDKIVGYDDYEDANKKANRKASAQDSFQNTLDFYDDKMLHSALGSLVSSIEEDEEEQEQQVSDKSEAGRKESSYDYDDIMLYSPSRTRTRRRTSSPSSNRKTVHKTETVSSLFAGFLKPKASKNHYKEEVEYKEEPEYKEKSKHKEKSAEKEYYTPDEPIVYTVKEDIEEDNNDVAGDMVYKSPPSVKIFILLFLVLSLVIFSVLILKLNDTNQKLFEAGLKIEKYEAQDDYDGLKEENKSLAERITELEAENASLKSSVPDDTEGNVDMQVSEGDLPAGSATTYTVKPNDNLWNISVKTLGKGSRYTEILEASGYNKNTVIRPGMVLTIPPID